MDAAVVGKVTFEVSVIDLLNFGGTNIMRSGDDVYKCGHLIDLGVVSESVKTCKIEGLCLQSSHPDQSPHTITIDTNKKFDEWKFYCSCKAGNGSKCKHIYAALLHIHHEKALDRLFCTQRQQSWGKISKEVAQGVLEPDIIQNLSEFRNFKPKEYTLAQKEFKENEQMLFSSKKSAIAKFLHRAAEIKKPQSSDSQFDENEKEVRGFLKTLFQATNFNLRSFIFTNMPQNLLNFYNKRICITVDEAVEVNVKSRDQKGLFWLSERKLRITASECYTLFTAAKNPNVEWDKKLDSYFKPKPDIKNFKVGRAEEPNAIKQYELKSKQRVRKMELIIHPTCPWMGFSPDGFVFETNTVVEVKTIMNEANLSFEDALKQLQYLVSLNGRYCLREKHKYYAQIQLGMYFLCVLKADLVINNYKTKEIHIVNVTYNHKFVQELLSSLKSIYFTHVLPYVFEKFTTLVDKAKYS